MNTLEHKVALVTGGNSGIGYAAARELRAQGATVIITGRRKDAVEKAAAELGVTGLVADQSSVADTDALKEQVETVFGKIDILFINAGIASMAMIEQGSEAHFDSIMNINFRGAYFTLHRFIPLLNDGASVIFLSSIVANTFGPGTAVYSASKAALNALMKTAALELAPRRIRVNAVSPGPIDTEVMNKAGLDAGTLAHIKATLADRIPLRRTGKAEEVAKLVAYLAGSDAGYITGSEFVTDGGMAIPSSR